MAPLSLRNQVWRSNFFFCFKVINQIRIRVKKTNTRIINFYLAVTSKWKEKKEEAKGLELRKGFHVCRGDQYYF